MDSKAYCSILAKGLPATLKKYKIKKKDFIFQQDNDPKHKSKFTQAWFAKNRYVQLDWPPSSPDMNIIEHVWDHLEKLIRAREHHPRNKDELWAALQEEWYGISPAYIKNLYESLPRRLESLRVKKGEHTNY